jgi:type IV pilus assembly protein PilV
MHLNTRNLVRLNLPRRARGFTLIEVMVAIVILSVGMLGVAGLMVTGIQFSHSSLQRSQATQLAYDMIDRMRSNQAGVELADAAGGGGNYHRPIGNVTASNSPYIINKPNCVGATGAALGCLPGEMADQDSWEWQRAVAERLGGGVAIVCRDSSNSPGTYEGTTITHKCDGIGPKYAIKIYWRDDRSDDAHATGTAQYQVFMTNFLP